jgi:peroxiredoxin
MRADNLLGLPANLPVPADDGAARHLTGMRLPSVTLQGTHGQPVQIDLIGAPRAVIYAYPRTGQPDEEALGGNAAWDEIPGARGCTPQSCAFRDHHAELWALGAEVYGLSTQTSAYQQEMVARLHLPFPVLSDENLLLTRALRLPTLVVEGVTLLKRLTLIVREGRVEHVMYPVFPPDQNAGQVVSWLRQHPL